MDTGEECFVKCLDTIGREEEDTTIILDVTETENMRKGSDTNSWLAHINLFLLTRRPP